MRFHANENIEVEVVEFLRGLGHDVTYAAEIEPRASDEQVLDRATAERRILITSDRDFGELCFLRGRPGHGVILLRGSDLTAQGRIRMLRQVLECNRELDAGVFIVVSDKGIRRRPFPKPKA